MKIASLSAALLIAASSSVAFANGNSGAAQTMVVDLRAGLGSAAPTVSGKNAFAKGDSGWGNAGSREVSGTQVSKSGKSK